MRFDLEEVILLTSTKEKINDVYIPSGAIPHPDGGLVSVYRKIDHIAGRATLENLKSLCDSKGYEMKRYARFE